MLFRHSCLSACLPIGVKVVFSQTTLSTQASQHNPNQKGWKCTMLPIASHPNKQGKGKHVSPCIHSEVPSDYLMSAQCLLVLNTTAALQPKILQGLRLDVRLVLLKPASTSPQSSLHFHVEDWISKKPREDKRQAREQNWILITTKQAIVSVKSSALKA